MRRPSLERPSTVPTEDQGRRMSTDLIGRASGLSERMAMLRRKALQEAITITLFFKKKFPLDWGSLPNCLVTKCVFAVIVTNSALPFPVLITRKKPCLLKPFPAGFDLGLPEALPSRSCTRKASLCHSRCLAATRTHLRVHLLTPHLPGRLE